MHRNRTAVATKDSKLLLTCASLNFNSIILNNYLKNRQALILLYKNPNRVYLIYLILIISRKVSTWKARRILLLNRNV